MKASFLNLIGLFLLVFLLISCNRKNYSANFRIEQKKNLTLNVPKENQSIDFSTRLINHKTIELNDDLSKNVMPTTNLEKNEEGLLSVSKNVHKPLFLDSYSQQKVYNYSKSSTVQKGKLKKRQSFFNKLIHPFQNKIENIINNYKVLADSAPKMEGLSVAGFISAIVGLLVAGLILGALAIIFGAIGLGKISSNPGKYSGQGFAIAAIIIGIIDIVAVLIFLSTI